MQERICRHILRTAVSRTAPRPFSARARALPCHIARNTEAAADLASGVAFKYRKMDGIVSTNQEREKAESAGGVDNPPTTQVTSVLLPFISLP